VLDGRIVVHVGFVVFDVGEGLVRVCSVYDLVFNTLRFGFFIADK
jgi:hypothetical protein